MKKLGFAFLLLIGIVGYAQENNNIVEDKTSNYEATKTEVLKQNHTQPKSTSIKQEKVRKYCKHNHDAHNDLVSKDAKIKARRYSKKGSKIRNILPPPL